MAGFCIDYKGVITPSVSSFKGPGFFETLIEAKIESYPLKIEYLKKSLKYSKKNKHEKIKRKLRTYIKNLKIIERDYPEYFI